MQAVRTLIATAAVTRRPTPHARFELAAALQLREDGVSRLDLPLLSSPAIASQGTVYVGFGEVKLCASLSFATGQTPNCAPVFPSSA